MAPLLPCLQFAYGACELIFNPFREWPRKGPFNKKFITYVRNNNIAWYQKVSLLGYLSSYLVRRPVNAVKHSQV
jgi:hypothetical protein